MGQYSDEVLMQTDDTPNRLQRMPAPTEDPATTATQIVINWVMLTDELDTGRDPVTYYKIYWDQGKNSWNEIKTSPKNTLVLTFTWGPPSYSILNGTTYKFRVRP